MNALNGMTTTSGDRPLGVLIPPDSLWSERLARRGDSPAETGHDHPWRCRPLAFGYGEWVASAEARVLASGAWGSPQHG